MFDVAVQKTLGDFALDVRFRSTAAVTALFGPSGAGKTSIVNAIAGLLTPERGHIAIGDAVLFDSKKRISVSAHRRRVRVVFQESRLFPHLNVRQNLVYGRWIAGHSAGEKLDEVAKLLGLEALFSRRPRALSGGERQRVAIGRALLADPTALLLDEPLASLDAARKQEIIPYLERLVATARIPILYVSHAREEIERLAGTVVMLDGGRVKAVEEVKR
ncbi:MAG TPA: molybdenum ABC transporter ATP-binding protein [Xanthobacteraceae bacterium]|nr:molybdenum ABC transporter ATP-binding protein [Xanthobacteraceae bacterium]